MRGKYSTPVRIAEHEIMEELFREARDEGGKINLSKQIFLPEYVSIILHLPPIQELAPRQVEQLVPKADAPISGALPLSHVLLQELPLPILQTATSFLQEETSLCLLVKERFP